MIYSPYELIRLQPGEVDEVDDLAAFVNDYLSVAKLPEDGHGTVPIAIRLTPKITVRVLQALEGRCRRAGWIVWWGEDLSGIASFGCASATVDDVLSDRLEEIAIFLELPEDVKDEEKRAYKVWTR